MPDPKEPGDKIGLGDAAYAGVMSALVAKINATKLDKPKLLPMSRRRKLAMKWLSFLVTESLRPNWQRFSPASNIGQIFSAAGLSRLLRSLVPFTMMAVLGANVFQRDFTQIAHSARLDSRGLLMELGSMLLELSWKFGLVMLAWSGLDYFLQRRNYEQSLRMTKQEVKQESKDTDGNPLIRGRIQAVAPRTDAQDAGKVMVPARHGRHHQPHALCRGPGISSRKLCLLRWS